MLLTEIRTLLLKEFLLEWRQKYAINGMLLYLASTILVCYLSFNLKPNQLNALTWNALFKIFLFSTVNVAKSFYGSGLYMIEELILSVYLLCVSITNCNCRAKK